MVMQKKVLLHVASNFLGKFCYDGSVCLRFDYRWSQIEALEAKSNLSVYQIELFNIKTYKEPGHIILSVS